MPDLRRHRRSPRPGVPDLRRHRIRAPHQDARGQHPGRHRHRQARAHGRPGRPGSERRPRRRRQPDRHRQTRPAFRARGRQPAHRGRRSGHDGRPRWRSRSADPDRDGRLEDSRRNAKRPQLPPARAGHAEAARPRRESAAISWPGRASSRRPNLSDRERELFEELRHLRPEGSS